MMKRRLLLIVVSAALLIVFGAAVALAQDGADDVPEPYRVLTNPFSWDDTSAQGEGEGLYRTSCLGCHGVDGGGISNADFSVPESRDMLEASPDRLFWILSEGMLAKGMPGYKSSLSEDQRWQTLTYLWSLGKAGTPGPSLGDTPAGDATLFLYVGGETDSGALALTAALEDDEGQPIRGVTVRFLIETDFFASGLMDIGDAVTDERGIAVLEHTPRQAGIRDVVARLESDRFKPAEYTIALTVEESATPFYWPRAGIHLPAPGEEVFIGPESAKHPGELGEAPTSALRLPGGVLSWLLIFVGVLLVFWCAYFFIMYQVLSIAMIGEPRNRGIRLVPLVGLAVIVFTGLALILMILVGPNSHPHLH